MESRRDKEAMNRNKEPKKVIKEVKGVVDEPPVVGDAGIKDDMKEKKMVTESQEGGVKGLPHQQVPQPGRNFSSEALEHI